MFEAGTDDIAPKVLEDGGVEISNDAAFDFSVRAIPDSSSCPRFKLGLSNRDRRRPLAFNRFRIHAAFELIAQVDKVSARRLYPIE